MEKHAHGEVCSCPVCLCVCVLCVCLRVCRPVSLIYCIGSNFKDAIQSLTAQVADLKHQYDDLFKIQQQILYIFSRYMRANPPGSGWWGWDEMRWRCGMRMCDICLDE